MPTQESFKYYHKLTPGALALVNQILDGRSWKVTAEELEPFGWQTVQQFRTSLLNFTRRKSIRLRTRCGTNCIFVQAVKKEPRVASAAGETK